MGLDVSHDCWSGPYSSFNRWRNNVARAAGYQFKDYDGHSAPVIDWDSITENELLGKWKDTPADPLVVLIAHYDCDGAIYPKQANALADRMESLVPLLVKENSVNLFQSDAEITQKFVDGLRLAVKRRQTVQFL